MKQFLNIVLIVLLAGADVRFPAQTPSSGKAPRKRPAPRRQVDTPASVIQELLDLAPPPRDFSLSGKEGEDTTSAEEAKPPADDAPIAALISYWKDRGSIPSAMTQRPSEKVAARLLDAMEDDPSLAFLFLPQLPDRPDTHDRLYKLLESDALDHLDPIFKPNLRDWLRQRSSYYRDELLRSARQADRRPEALDDLRALARLDWDAARPILERMATSSNAQAQAAAIGLLHQNAINSADSALAEKYRAILKEFVDRGVTGGDEAVEALRSLVNTEWEGQQEYVLSLFSNPALTKKDFPVAGDGGTVRVDVNLLTNFQFENKEKWCPLILRLVEGENRATRNAAVGWLLESFDSFTERRQKEEIIQRLLPWLQDETWAESDRNQYILILGDLQIPEAVPGLLQILTKESEAQFYGVVAATLARYRDARAVPALRLVLEKRDLDDDALSSVVTAIALSGGFSDDEMAADIETYIRLTFSEESKRRIRNSILNGEDEELPLPARIGRILVDSDEIPATPGVAARLIERARALRRAQPEISRQLLATIENTGLPVVYADLAERIGEGGADLDSLQIALDDREEMRTAAGDRLQALFAAGGYTAGLVAVLLDDAKLKEEVLNSKDARSHIALLAAARYLRDPLPVYTIGPWLKSPNRLLARAAEKYLESEDSPQARKLLLGLHPNQGYILGDVMTASSDSLVPIFQPWEEKLQKEIRSAAGPQEIYALVTPENNRLSTSIVVRVRAESAELSLYQVAGRRKIRRLSSRELADLRNFLLRDEIENLGPEPVPEEGNQHIYEYIRLTREGGRRVTLRQLGKAPKNNPTLHRQLAGFFYQLIHTGEMQLRYDLQDKMPGVEVLAADDRHPVLQICGEGGELRALINASGMGLDDSRPVEELGRWHTIDTNGIGRETQEPQACPMLQMIANFVHRNGMFGIYPLQGVPGRRGAALIQGGTSKNPGVWKFDGDAAPVRIVEGNYMRPVLSNDGIWLIADEQKTEGESTTYELIRRNLRTGQQWNIGKIGEKYLMAFGPIPSRKEILLTDVGYHGESSFGNQAYLLDPETGTGKWVKGEFAPLRDIILKDLQPTGKPHEFWAAMRNKIGRYDVMSFTFTPVLELPGIEIKENRLWVEEAAGKAWFIYEGHLLRVPLPGASKR